MGKFIDDLARGLEGLEDYNWLHSQSNSGVTYLVHQGDKRTYHSIIKLIPTRDEKYHIIGTVFSGRFTEPKARVYGYISNGPIGRLEVNREICGVFSARIRRHRNDTKTA